MPQLASFPKISFAVIAKTTYAPTHTFSHINWIPSEPPLLDLISLRCVKNRENNAERCCEDITLELHRILLL